MRRFFKSVRKRKRRLSIIVILVFYLSSKVNAVPIGGVDGLLLPKPPRCRNMGNLSRASTGVSTTLRERPQNENKENVVYYSSEFDSIFENRQLQKKYKHSKDFGIIGNYNPVNGKLFRDKIIEHMKSSEIIYGSYRGQEVIHYFNKDTGLNVMINGETKKFISGWKLENDQLENMLNRGSL